MLCASLEENQVTAPRLHYCFLTIPSFFGLYFIDCWISNYSFLPFGTQGRSWGWSLFPTTNGSQRSFCAQEPHRTLLCFSCFEDKMGAHVWQCLVRSRIFPALSINKGCHRHQKLQPLGMVNWWALREFRKERISALLQPSDYNHSPQWVLRKFRRLKKLKNLVPDSWGAWQMNNFNEPQLLLLPLNIEKH